MNAQGLQKCPLSAAGTPLRLQADRLHRCGRCALQRATQAAKRTSLATGTASELCPLALAPPWAPITSPSARQGFSRLCPLRKAPRIQPDGERQVFYMSATRPAERRYPGALRTGRQIRRGRGACPWWGSMSQGGGKQRRAAPVSMRHAGGRTRAGRAGRRRGWGRRQGMTTAMYAKGPGVLGSGRDESGVPRLGLSGSEEGAWPGKVRRHGGSVGVRAGARSGQAQPGGQGVIGRAGRHRRPAPEHSSSHSPVIMPVSRVARV